MDRRTTDGSASDKLCYVSSGAKKNPSNPLIFSYFHALTKSLTRVYTKFSGRLSEEPFPGMIQKFPCTGIFIYPNFRT